MKYVKSQRGTELLSIDGYTFCVKSVSGMQRRWICSTHSNRKCRAAAVTYDDQIIKANNIHNHNKLARPSDFNIKAVKTMKF